ncbi:MAG: rhodanese-like domain-containing protein [Nitrospiraceae bacterium]|nr:MAG: rhodanese-like domain-containing protein [Nitrospiraceae bacterium]
MSYKINFNIELDCLDRDELLERINGQFNFVLIDTIGKYDGNRFKIKGATTISYPEVVDRRKEFELFDEIIIYCKHKDCMASKKVAIGLKMLNIPNVKIYEGGIDEWIANNLPVEQE